MKRETLLLTVLMLLTVLVGKAAEEIDGIYYNLDLDNNTAEVTKSTTQYTGSITIPEKVVYYGVEYSVNTIGDDAFRDCVNLSYVYLPEGITRISSTAFTDSGIKSILIPSSVTSIGFAAFSGCNNLETIKVAEGNPVFDSRENCNAIIETETNKLIRGGLNTIIPQSVTIIGDRSFEGCRRLVRFVIPSNITHIEDVAFASCSSLSEIIISDGVTYIGSYAFSWCTSLKTITIPKSVTTIKKNAFSSSLAITSVKVEWVTPLTSNIFPNRVNATLYVPAGCKAAYEAADYWKEFKEIIEIKNVGETFIAKTEEGVDMCFMVTSAYPLEVQVGDEKGEGIHSFPTDYSGGITIPSTANGYKVTRIGSWAFNWCHGLTSVNIPETVTSIGVQAFIGTSLTSVTFPNSLESIEGGAFQCCFSLNSIFIPKSVTSIAEESFEGSLNSIVVDRDNPIYDSRNNCNAIIKTATNELIRGCKNTIIPKTVTKIGRLGFCHCGSSFTSVVIPESIRSIGDGAFYGNDNLTEILSLIKEPMALTFDDGCWNGINPDEITLYVPKGTKELYESTEGWNAVKNITEVFNVDGIYYTVTSPDEMTVEVANGGSYDGDVVVPEKVAFGGNEFSVTSIGCGAFLYCTNLTSITIPFGVTKIDDVAFQGCFSLTSITIPESVTNIGCFAFEYCFDLTNIIIPNSVANIGEGAFAHCPGPTSINIPEGLTRIGINEIRNPFYGCSGLMSIVVDEGNTVYTSANDANVIIEKESNLLITGCKNTIIPDGVTRIGRYAFADCPDLTSITIPEGVISIDDRAFSGCTGLTSITIPNSVTSIGGAAFDVCTGLTSITIPNSVTSIGGIAFEYCI